MQKGQMCGLECSRTRLSSCTNILKTDAVHRNSISVFFRRSLCCVLGVEVFPTSEVAIVDCKLHLLCGLGLAISFTNIGVNGC